MDGCRFDGMIAERGELLVRVTGPWRGRIDDQRFFRKRIERQRSAFRQRMASGQCGDQRLFDEHLARQLRFVETQATKADVDASTF